MAWFRSAEMEYVSIIVQDHVAHDTVQRLGDIGCFQFVDLNGELTAFQRRYTPFIRRCDEMERVLRFLEAEMRKVNVEAEDVSMTDFRSWLSREEQTAAMEHDGVSLLELWEGRLAKYESELTEMTKYRESLLKAYNAKVEMRYVISQVEVFFATGTEDESVSALRPDHVRSMAGAGGGRGVDRDYLGGHGGDSGGSLLDSPGSHHKVPLLDVGAGGHASFAPIDLGGLAVGAGGSDTKKSEKDLEGGAAAAAGGDDGDGAGAGAGGDAPKGFGVHGLADRSMSFQHVAGVLRRDDRIPFERMLFRLSRGNCYSRFAELPEQLENEAGELVDNTVFLIMFRADSLAAKLRRLMDAFSAHRYDLPNFDNPHEVARTIQALEADIDAAARVLTEHRNTAMMSLRHIGASIGLYTKGVRREKATYHTLNLFHADMAGILRGQGWVLADSVPRVQQAIRDAHARGGGGGGTLPSYLNRVEGKKPTPPTHFATNKFTYPFQQMVNTYGVPRYREANPALFSAITFPFLFACMFGDVGHASILTLVAGLTVAFEDRISATKMGDMVKGIFSARYMFLLMGLFGIYCGLIYNDWFAMGANLFGTRWVMPDPANPNATAMTRAGPADDVYSFGIDPAWHISENELLYFNSFKMKLSVTLGVTQMVFGVFLKTMNAVHFRSKLDLWCECVPQMLFMVSFFGYMILLIFLKWSIDWTDPPPPADAPPGLINVLIGIVLAPGNVPNPMYHGQATVQVLIIVIMFLTVPIMLLAKPLLLRRWHRQAEERAKGRHTYSSGHHLAGDDEMHVHLAGSGAATRSRRAPSAPGVELGAIGDLDEDHGGAEPPVDAASAGSPTHGGEGFAAGHGGEDEEFNFGDLAIHQGIETIEFVLGSVSHTASYLRLWALSLAHSKLAGVFWNYALKTTIEMGNPVLIFVGYAVFAATTFGVLMCMDLMECFLHALRLHWVEFQSKFYKADGYKFEPFSFNEILMAGQ